MAVRQPLPLCDGDLGEVVKVVGVLPPVQEVAAIPARPARPARSAQPAKMPVGYFGGTRGRCLVLQLRAPLINPLVLDTTKRGENAVEMGVHHGLVVSWVLRHGQLKHFGYGKHGGGVPWTRPVNGKGGGGTICREDAGCAL